jgi:phosphohistidine swiveling domain-containing protein
MKHQYLFGKGESHPPISRVGHKAFSVFTLFPKLGIDTLPTILISPAFFSKLLEVASGSIQSRASRSFAQGETDSPSLRRRLDLELRDFELHQRTILRVSFPAKHASERYSVKPRFVSSKSEVFPICFEMACEIYSALGPESLTRPFAGMLQVFLHPDMSGILLSSNTRSIVEYTFGPLSDVSSGRTIPHRVEYRSESVLSSALPFDVRAIRDMEGRIRKSMPEGDFMLEWLEFNGKVYANDWRPAKHVAESGISEASSPDEDNSSTSDLGRGIQVVPGEVSGEARLVTLGSVASVQKGGILVIKEALPEYYQVLGKGVALISEAGGLCCHLAELAREAGIPSVFGVPEVTCKVKDGDRIIIRNGRVYRANPHF